MNIKSILCCAAVSASAMLVASDIPEVENVTMVQQSPGRLITVTYDLVNAPNGAVVTLDVQTNRTGAVTNNDDDWVSIGGEAVCNAKGEVWKKVAQGAGKTILWRPDKSWEGHKITLANGGARARVTAWPLDNTPDYMVVDLAAENTIRYYPSVDFLPGLAIGQKGAVTNNPAYKTSKLLMRKIMAHNVEWTMGSAAGETQRDATRETPHTVILTNNYYIGVFEITQAQWANIAVNSTAIANFTEEGAMRPMEKVSYNEIRNSVNTTTANTTYNWPADPNPSSFLGLLRTKTGLDFDLPSEAQWEFAARAGNGSGFWNDGSTVRNVDTDSNLNNLGRYKGNNPAGTASTSTMAPTSGGTAIVGSYAPSAWGLYDMHGNMWEWCLDWYEDGITNYDGKINIDFSASEKTLSGASGARRVLRGGSIHDNAGNCRAAYRNRDAPTFRYNLYGFRVACTAGLQ